MLVRPAVRKDLIGLGRVAQSAHWASYRGLLAPDTIGRLVADRFGPSALARRLLLGGMRVVCVGGEVVGFADGSVGDAAIFVDAIAVDPLERRRGIATALVEDLGGMRGDLPITADVILGNLEGEGFYESLGFVPGETALVRMFDEDVVERRWWREAVLSDPIAGSAARAR